MNTEELIRSYLLQELPTCERSSIEERLIVDPDFYEQLLIVEDELIDEYLEGNLSNKDGFEKCLLSTPQQYQKLKILMALREASRKERVTTKAELMSENVFSWLRTRLRTALASS